MSAPGEFTMAEHRFVGSLYFFAGIFGFLGNLLSLLIFWRKKPLAGTRGRIHAHIALVNMMIVLGTPFSGSSAMAGRWLFGETGCKFYGMETYIGGMGSISFACLLCLQRHYYMTSPETYDASGISTILSLTGWLYSIGIAVAPVLGWNSFEAEESGTACGLNFKNDDFSHRSYFIAISIVNAIMMFAAIVSLRSAFKSRLPLKAEADDWFTNNQLNWIAVANLIIVSIQFAPYTYFGVWALFNHETKMTMLASVISPLTAKLMTIFYPVAYMVASDKFRNAFRSLACGPSMDGKEN